MFVIRYPSLLVLILVPTTFLGRCRGLRGPSLLPACLDPWTRTSPSDDSMGGIQELLAKRKRLASQAKSEAKASFNSTVVKSPQVMDLEPEMAEQARKKFYGDKRFSDFTVICHGKEYHVHRVLVSTQSKWFEACCTAPFKEAADRSVTLHEDDPVAIEKMFQYFYQGEYDTIITATPPKLEEKGPSNAIQLHAYVYVVAEKYDCPTLRDQALEGFRDQISIGGFLRLRGAVLAAYQQVELPESVKALKAAVLEGWVGFDKIGFHEREVRQLFKDVPEFAEDLAFGYLTAPKGFFLPSYDPIYMT
ncbi:hypothetical protein HII31_10495 [Pseudocercospora fuligena]|uniref:BTB domain-containing protein n=1 Tax=Pseudocercospora fuligena TaxID=685502 RepID=A0A8H6VIN5_9PEZI|nr:hypothetical protein HII31_10495 [Pseudocercospora fuligena]